jgi:glycosyltransferase involved in cell wall biosynthesis
LVNRPARPETAAGALELPPLAPDPTPPPPPAPRLDKDSRLLSVVVPVYCEQDSLAELHAQLSDVLDALGLRYEILFVDDGSTDASFAVLSGLAARDDGSTKVVRLATNSGKAAALNVGFRLAQGDVVITMDADLQDDPAEIPRMLEKIDEGFDLVSGWKSVRHDPWHKTLPSRIFNRVVRWTCRIPLHDVNCGFKAYTRRTIVGLSLYGELHRFVPVIAASAGARITEIAVRHRPRIHGRSKYGLGRLPKGLLDLLTVLLTTRFLSRPMHFFGWIGLLGMGVGGAMLGYLAVLWLLGHRPIGNRPMLLYGVLFAIMGVQVLSVGLLAELINRLSRDRELPWIQERLGFGDPPAARAPGQRP